MTLSWVGSPVVAPGSLPLSHQGSPSACRGRRCRFSPWLARRPWSRKWHPTAVFSPGESQGQRSLAGYSLWGHKESDITERAMGQACGDPDTDTGSSCHWTGVCYIRELQPRRSVRPGPAILWQQAKNGRQLQA